MVHNAAPARDDDGRLADLADLLVVNRVEAGMMTGLATDSVEGAMAAARPCRRGWPRSSSTLGGAGVIHAAGGGEPVSEPAFRADVVSSHGAGDLFVGALVAQLAHGSETDAAIRYAQAAAALHVSAPVDRRT